LRIASGRFAVGRNLQGVSPQMEAADKAAVKYIFIMKVAWFSAGITSAVACKYAIKLYNDVELYLNAKTGTSKKLTSLKIKNTAIILT